MLYVKPKYTQHLIHNNTQQKFNTKIQHNILTQHFNKPFFEHNKIVVRIVCTNCVYNSVAIFVATSSQSFLAQYCAHEPTYIYKHL